MNKLELGINSYLEGDANSAEKVLREYMEETTYPESQAYYYMGLICDDSGKTTDAGIYFQKALEMEPDKSIYHYRLGAVYAQLMLFAQAIPRLEATLAKNPEHVRAHFVLGSMYMKNGDLVKAAAQFRNALQISPDYAPGYYELGNALYYSGNMAEAKEAFTKALSLNNDLVEARQKLALITS